MSAENKLEPVLRLEGRCVKGREVQIKIFEEPDGRFQTQTHGLPLLSTEGKVLHEGWVSPFSSPDRKIEDAKRDIMTLVKDRIFDVLKVHVSPDDFEWQEISSK